MDLKEFFSQHKNVALAFSGGADSAYLLYAAKMYAENVTAYYVKTQFQPEFEYLDAARLAKELGVQLCVIYGDVLADGQIRRNAPDRCYHCKKTIMRLIKKQASLDGYDEIIDGTNASDAADDRPGMRVLSEDGILSPLRICGISKAQLRSLSKHAGLFTWDKPAYACLATRIKCGEELSAEKLRRAEAAEEFLAGLGFSDFRVRCSSGKALLQFTQAQHGLAQQCFEQICSELGKYFDDVRIDDVPREVSV